MSLRDPVCGMPLKIDVARYKSLMFGKEYYFCSKDCMNSFVEGPRIAYFSMEIGVQSEIPTYSGGLGVLAGDTVRSSADLRIPLVALTLISKKGYVRQKIMNDGTQLDFPDVWDPSKYFRLLPNIINVKIEGRDVQIQTWLFEQQSMTGSMVPILFLDTDIEGNALEDRSITDFLYGGDDKYRLKQEIVLGIGGKRMLDSLNINIRKYHMNEGHSSLLTLELLKKNNTNPDNVRNLCVFTTHTPVEAAFDKFPYDVVEKVLGAEVPLELIKAYGGEDRLNMTFLALKLSRYINGVTKSHMEYSSKLFPGYQIRSVTNGVHSSWWTCECFRALFDKYIPGWANEPELLVRVDGISDEEIWEAHLKSKVNLMQLIKDNKNIEMDINTLTIGFARRAAAYKRGTLIFTDLERLRKISKIGKMQFVFAGRAHPKDQAGKEMIKSIYNYMNQLKEEIEVVYLENYDMDMAARITSGVDVWLNTPLPPLEASGTSGMKAAHNGVINFSVLEGWWIEGCVEGVTGWAIGPHPNEQIDEGSRRKLELEDLYGKLEYLVLPTFYEERDRWINIMKNSIGKVAYYFNSHRMMRRYVTEAYLI